jgi:4-azaleucine resistance transporter AzlC
VAAVALGLSFGVVARPLMGTVAPIVMSLVVFAGGAQFAATAVLAAGGGALPAVVAGILMNLRFIPMGVAVAASLPGRAGRRAVEGQALTDVSWALANQGEGRFDRDVLLGATLVQYPAWAAGTALGVFVGGALGDPLALGLDAIFPAFFLALLAAELRAPMPRAAALLGAVIALAALPVAPPGVPIIAACLAGLLALRR